MFTEIKTNWKAVIYDLKKQAAFDQWKLIIDQEYENHIVHPSKNLIFACFNYFDIEQTKVVILGQDPYALPNMANGLAFSTNNTKLPQSLKNIFKELYNDLKIQRTNGDLSDWAKQGVLLLNTRLTVREDCSKTHKKISYDWLINDVIQTIDHKCENVVFVLWGNEAQTKAKLIKNPSHLIIKSAHPSPLSAHHGFFNSQPFSKINNFLKEKKQKQINW